MESLITVYNTLPQNISLLQPSVLKCVCKDLHEYFTRNNIDNFIMPYLSWELFCDFNMSPAIFQQQKFENVLIQSTRIDPDIIKHAYDMGWRYDFRTMKYLIQSEHECTLAAMQALREVGCHWGSETLDLLIEMSCTRDVKELIDFCLSDGYPVLQEHLVHAINVGTANIVGSIINVLIIRGLRICDYNISYMIRKRIERFDNFEHFRDTYFDQPGPFPLWYNVHLVPQTTDTSDIINDLWDTACTLRDARIMYFNWNRYKN